MKAHWTDELVKMDACAEAVEWARTQPSLARAWRVCPRGDWMLWLAEKRHVDRKRLTWVACQCARTALRYVPDGEALPLRCIEVTEAWTRGEATLDEVRAAGAAAWAAGAAWAAWAAGAAAWAARAARDAAGAARAAAGAARAAAGAAAGAAGAAAWAARDAAGAARDASLAESARIVRREWPTVASLTGGGE